MKKKTLLALALSMALVLGSVTNPLSARADVLGSEETVTGEERGGEVAAGEKESVVEPTGNVTEGESIAESGGNAAENESGEEPSGDVTEAEAGTEEASGEPSEDAEEAENGRIRHRGTRRHSRGRSGKRIRRFWSGYKSNS